MRSLRLSRLAVPILLTAACTEPPPAEAPPSVLDPEAVEVAEVAETFLAALSSGDTAVLARLMAPGGMIYSVVEREGGPTLRAVSRAEFLESRGSGGRELLERMWEPEVSVDHGVAMVWTPYDLYLSGEFSHCGIDLFTLLKGTEGWQVASLTFNVVREGCSPSPLGPPERSGQ